MVKGQRQPNNKTCGQTCVAMVGGIPVEESIKMFGHSNSTNHISQRRILSELGIETTEQVKVDNRRKWELPNFAIVRIVQRTRKMGHAIVYHEGKFYDPCYDKPFNSKQELFDHYGQWGKVKISHYYEIKK